MITSPLPPPASSLNSAAIGGSVGAILIVIVIIILFIVYKRRQSALNAPAPALSLAELVRRLPEDTLYVSNPAFDSIESSVQ